MSLPIPLDEDGAAAPPRVNGELAFEAPWESRLFGMTISLVEAGRLDWEAFRQRLVGSIADWEAANGGESWSYWQHWRRALEGSLDETGLLAAPEVAQREKKLASRPHGHDHHHDHSHQHGHPQDDDHGEHTHER